MNTASVKLRRFVRASQVGFRKRMAKHRDRELDGKSDESQKEAPTESAIQAEVVTEEPAETNQHPVLVSLSEEQESDIVRQLNDLSRNVHSEIVGSD